MTTMLRRREPSPRGADAFYGWGVWRGGFCCSTPGRGARRGARAQRPDVVPEKVPETVPGTVPETVPEQVPETVPEMVPEITARNHGLIFVACPKKTWPPCRGLPEIICGVNP